MPLLSWIALGLIVGFAGARFVNKTGEGLRLDIAVGVAGAIVGGLLFNAAGIHDYRRESVEPFCCCNWFGRRALGLACLGSEGIERGWRSASR